MLFFCNAAPSTMTYPLSLHDALPILWLGARYLAHRGEIKLTLVAPHADSVRDRKSTRLNSSHSSISYAVFCLKKKNIISPVPVHLVPRWIGAPHFLSVVGETRVLPAA